MKSNFGIFESCCLAIAVGILTSQSLSGASIFTDANWVSLGGVPGTDHFVEAAVVDGFGNLYVGGTFTDVEGIVSNAVAMWNGSNWSAVGVLHGVVFALAVSGADIYAGGSSRQRRGTSPIP